MKTIALAILLSLQCSLLSTTAAAQDEPEYKMEVGAGIGLTNYLGDFNGNLTKDIQPMAGLVVKYKTNPRMAWSAMLNYGQLKGNSKNVNTYYPDYAG